MPVLKRITYQIVIAAAALLACNISLHAQKTADTLSSSKLKKLSLEELMDIEVTSLSLRSEKLKEVASPVQVITGENIYRSAATRLPEALRLASNLQIGQANSHDWAITSRGFNGLPSAGGLLANKLLVMIDGRSVYNPLYGGVFWDVQNVMLSSIDRVEVVSGPGGTLWGANAVNGVIHVIRKSAKETQGLYVSGAGGSLLQDQAEVQYGFRLDSNIFCRIYGQRFDQKHTELLNGKDAMDEWNATQGGFRLDYYQSKANTLTFQGDFYGNTENRLTRLTQVDGQNMQFDFSHLFSDRSDFRVRGYFDRTWRETPNAAKPFYYQLYTYNLDVQQHFAAGSSQNIIFGVGYRLQQDEASNGIDPLSRTMPLYSGFIQDEIILAPDLLKLTIGSKFLNNFFSGFEIQPCARLGWTPSERHTIWSSVSRSVRTPTRFDSDVTKTPVKFDSEKIIAYELGYRLHPVEQLSFSFSGFYNLYTDLRSLDSGTTASVPVVLANSQNAESWGFEFFGTLKATDWWRLRGGYTYFEKNIYPTSPKVFPVSVAFEGVDPRNQCMLQSMMDLPKDLSLDITGRYVDVLPAVLTLPAVPAYITFDMRVAWHLKPFEISLIGQNLLEDQHTETGSGQIPRSFYAKIICQF